MIAEITSAYRYGSGFEQGLVSSVLWFVIATLWHWLSLSHEVVNSYMRHIQVCQATAKGHDISCIARAGHQLDTGQSNTWPMAVGESLLQLVIFWFVGLVLIAGSRWAIRALEPSATIA